MGPIILLDKSALQSLSYDEIGFLHKHYYAVIAPVLIYEVLGDLSKYDGQEEEFSKVAKKLFAGDSQINVDHRILCILSLLGNKVVMDRRPVVGGGVEVKTAKGEKGIFFDEPPERKLIRKWQQGQYSLIEKVTSKTWRKISKSFDMDRYKKVFLETNSDIPQVKTLEKAYSEVYKLTMNINSQNFYLNFLINEYNATLRQRLIILNRWKTRSTALLCDFAPYAFFCLQVFLVFHFGLANNLITTRPTNAIDLEYLYYLPFCMVFSSGDKFQKEISRIFLAANQDFVESSILKRDLGKIKDEFYSLSAEEKQKRFYDYGSYPPQNSNSITYQLWKKHMKPWKPGSGNIKMTKETEKRLWDEKFQPMIDAIKEYEKKQKQ